MFEKNYILFYNLEMTKLSTEPYKGVRDFLPNELALQNYIFSTWRKTCQQFGYQEYSASILEPTELYTEKSGEEIVNEQTYSFIDRGERNVTLRPEMTPTVARLIAKEKHNLSFPVRFFSLPNLFRYERPQRGRLREHWQLNCDIFGADSDDAEFEIIKLAAQVLFNFGAKSEDFEVRINDRRLINSALQKFGLNDEQSYQFQKLLDKKNKIDNFETEAEKILGQKITWKLAADEKMLNLIARLTKNNISVKFDDTIVRGFDYYTGVVFEIYDTNQENSRALFGGGRYDDLLALFGDDKISAVGFGMGDVTAADFLKTHHLIPKLNYAADLVLTAVNPELNEVCDKIADLLRPEINVVIDYSNKKVGDKIRKSEKDNIKFILIFGEDELKDWKFKIKNIQSGEENLVPLEQVGQYIKSH